MSWALVISGSDEDYTSLLSYIVNFNELCMGNDSKEVQRRKVVMDDAQLECEVVHSVIENKYYRAEIAYVFVDATTLAMEQLGDMSSRCDAVIVIDDARSVALEHKLFTVIEEKEIDVSTKLFVTLAADAATVTEEHRAQRIGWCLDNQFEYIQIDKSNPVEGWNEREKDGLPRLIEALGSTMWQGMEMQGKSAHSEAKSELKRSEEAPAVAEITATEDVEQAQPDVLELIAHTEQELQLPNYGELGDDDSHDDDGMGAFGGILQSVAMIRNAAMNGKLSDEDRRAKAAEMALTLARTLGIDMDDSDDEADV